MEGSSVLLVIESFGIPFWLVWFNRLRCHRVPRTLKLLIPTKHIFLRVHSDTQELLMRPSDLLKTGGSPWSLHDAIVSALTKFITWKYNDDECIWSEERV